ncbi:MAG: hypothetical protein KDK74_05555 [Cephaloticoccus sp.]|nr:hypothetical protein [Cephaloticoccus sp.]
MSFAQQCYSATLRLTGKSGILPLCTGLFILRGEFFANAMARTKARFRISIADNQTGRRLKVELIGDPGYWGERRFKLRVNDREARRIKRATLTEVFDRLRRWTVRQSGDAK